MFSFKTAGGFPSKVFLSIFIDAPNLDNSVCKACKRSVSLILKVDKPDNLKVIFNPKQVTAKVCAKSGKSVKSALKFLGKIGFSFFLSRIEFSSKEVSTPKYL